MRRFAARTEVPVDRSEQEIKRVLREYGATKIGTMSEPGRATLYFDVKGREVQIAIPMPKTAAPDVPRQTRATRDADAEERRRWRVLVLWTKGMFEAVNSGIMTFDQAFLGYLVVPGKGTTIGSMIVPNLDALYAGESLPKLLADNPQ